MKIRIIYISILALVLSLTACSGGDNGGSNGGGDNGGDKILPPEAAILISPVKNEECNQGNIVSDTESSVLFEWDKAQNANSYTLVLKNLDNNSTTEKTASTNKVSITIKRGTPYSWYVVSKSNKTTTTAQSETWNFFNSGPGVENYAPFPAEAVAPTMGSTVSSPVTLEWAGNDLDNDIVSYDVYLDTNNPPTQVQKAATSSNSEANIALNADTVYYWMIITKDEVGNTSNSPVFEFRTAP